MNRKALVLSSFIVCLSVLVACSNDDTPVVKEILPVHNYFRGYVNDEYVCIEQNVNWDTRIYHTSSERMGEDITYYDWRVKFSDDYKDFEEVKSSPGLYIQLTPLRIAEYAIMADSMGWKKNAIHLSMDNGNVQYVPNPRKPFQLIVNGIYKGSLITDAPLICGTMEGTLYNSTNPNDSITFHDVEFQVE